MIRTSFTEVFGVRHPLIQAGMGDANPDLVVAVCEAGALGSLGTIGKPLDQVAAEIAEVRSRTNHPFAVNIVTFDWAPFARDMVAVAIKAGAPAITLSFGDPAPGISACHETGVRAMAQVQDLAQARHALALGVDVLVVQGNEAGGHTGLRGTLSFAAQALDLAGETPVAVAGGIADGRGVAAVLALGAAAAVMGTRFKTCTEHPAQPREKTEILQSDGGDTFAGPENDLAYGLVWPPGVVGRAIRNGFTQEWEGKGDTIRQKVAADGRPFGFVMDLYQQGTSVNWAGESAGLVSRSQPAAEVVEDVMREAEERLRSVTAMLQPQKTSA